MSLFHVCYHYFTRNLGHFAFEDSSSDFVSEHLKVSGYDAVPTPCLPPNSVPGRTFRSQPLGLRLWLRIPVYYSYFGVRTVIFDYWKCVHRQWTPDARLQTATLPCQVRRLRVPPLFDYPRLLASHPNNNPHEGFALIRCGFSSSNYVTGILPNHLLSVLLR